MRHLRSSTSLPIHPRTGRTAVGVLSSGRIVWPVAGGADDDPPADDQPPGEDPPPGNGSDTEPDDLQAEIDKWKRHSRMWEERAKANSKAAERLQELEDAEKTEIERVTARAETAERERDAAVARAERYEVAAEVGLPLDLAGRIQGSTRDELVEDANQLKQLVGAPSEPPQPGKPKPDKSQGARPGDPPDPWEEGRERAARRYGKND